MLDDGDAFVLVADNRDDIKAAVEPDAVLLDVRISHVADVANFLAVDGDFNR